MTQNEMLLHHMRVHGSVTTMEAFSKYGVTRLSARIWELRKAGHTIVRMMEKNDNGKTYARFFLRED